MVAVNPVQLVGTGLSLGVVHVLTGPDHLSALATLSVGSSWRAFWLGIRWGLGHSSGLFIVATVFLLLDGAVDINKIDAYCNWIVGVSMVVLGGYSMYITFRNERSKRRQMLSSMSMVELEDLRIDLDDLDNSQLEMEMELDLELESSENELQNETEISEEDARLQRGGRIGNVSEEAEANDNPLQDPFTQKLVAFGVGIIHGIAGPGGILGVLPAVQLASWTWSMLYLGSFAFTSTLCMGLFAMVYGEVTARASDSARVTLCLNYFSASLSIVVGIIWIILIALGKLSDVFH